MWDKDALLQQEALGIFGVNFVYGAFYYRTSPQQFIRSLVDNLNTDRIEVDMLTFSGPAFAQVDNRLLSLALVQTGLTNAVMFGADGDVLQPSEVLHKKAVLVERGSFRPVTRVNVDMHNLLAAGQLDAEDFLARVDLLGAVGFTVLISNYPEFYRLTSYCRRYTKEMIGVVLGINNLVEIFDEKYYDNLPGGILESFGRMFRNSVKLYIYPMRAETFGRYVAAGTATGPIPPLPADALISAENLQVVPHLRHLYAHLLENHYIESLAGGNPATLSIVTRDVLTKIRSHDATWEEAVPPAVAQTIKERSLFGYGQPAAPVAKDAV